MALLAAITSGEEGSSPPSSPSRRAASHDALQAKFGGWVSANFYRPWDRKATGYNAVAIGDTLRDNRVVRVLYDSGNKYVTSLMSFDYISSLGACFTRRMRPAPHAKPPLGYGGGLIRVVGYTVIYLVIEAIVDGVRQADLQAVHVTVVDTPGATQQLGVIILNDETSRDPAEPLGALWHARQDGSTDVTPSVAGGLLVPRDDVEAALIETPLADASAFVHAQLTDVTSASTLALQIATQTSLPVPMRAQLDEILAELLRGSMTSAGSTETDKKWVYLFKAFRLARMNGAQTGGAAAQELSQLDGIAVRPPYVSRLFDASSAHAPLWEKLSPAAPNVLDVLTPVATLDGSASARAPVASRVLHGTDTIAPRVGARVDPGTDPPQSNSAPSPLAHRAAPTDGLRLRPAQAVPRPLGAGASPPPVATEAAASAAGSVTATSKACQLLPCAQCSAPRAQFAQLPTLVGYGLDVPPPHFCNGNCRLAYNESRGLGTLASVRLTKPAPPTRFLPVTRVREVGSAVYDPISEHNDMLVARAIPAPDMRALEAESRAARVLPARRLVALERHPQPSARNRLLVPALSFVAGPRSSERREHPSRHGVYRHDFPAYPDLLHIDGRVRGWNALDGHRHGGSHGAAHAQLQRERSDDNAATRKFASAHARASHSAHAPSSRNRSRGSAVAPPAPLPQLADVTLGGAGTQRATVPAAATPDEREAFIAAQVQLPSDDAVFARTVRGILVANSAAFQPFPADNEQRPEVELKVKPGTKSILRRARPLAPPKHAATHKELVKQLNDKMCEVLHDPYNVPVGVVRIISPLVVVSRKDSPDARITGDYTELNKHLEDVDHTFPDVRQCLQATKGKSWFSKIDLSRGFHNIRLSPSCRDLTCIATPWGVIRYTTLPMGPSTAPALLARVLETALDSLIREGVCITYFDDILVQSASRAEHAAHLARVLKALGDNGFRVSLSKSTLCRREVDFLGYIVDGSTIRAAPERVQGWASLAPPNTIKSMRSFIGVASYLRDSFPHIEDRLAPYRDAIEGKASGPLPRKFWSHSRLADFADIKKILSNPDVLLLPDYNKPFLIRSDASDIALGGSILQEDASGTLRAVAFFSHRFSKAEQRWNVSEREAFAFVWAMHRFRSILKHARSIFIETDHIALTYVKESTNAKVRRWWHSLLGFNVKFVRHIAGVDNTVADALSRLESIDPISRESIDPRQAWLLTITGAPGARDDVVVIDESDDDLDTLLSRAAAAARSVPADELSRHAQFTRQLAGGEDAFSRLDAALAGASPVLRTNRDGDYGLLEFADAVVDRPSWMFDEDDDFMHADASVVARPASVYAVDATVAPSHSVSPSAAPHAATGATPTADSVFDYVLRNDFSIDPDEAPLLLSPAQGVALSSMLDDVIAAQNLPAASAQRKAGVERGLLLHASRRGVNCITRGNALWLPSIPETAHLRASLLKAVHDAAGHRSVAYVIKALEAVCYWDGCRRDAVKYIKSCPSCQLKARQPARYKHGLYGNLGASVPRECIEVDFLGAFEVSTGAAPDPSVPNQYILSVVDVFSRYTCLYTCEKADAETVVNVLRRYFSDFGFPQSVRSDRGPHLDNKVVSEFLESYGVHHALSPASQSEGQTHVERMHRTALEMLRAYVRNKPSKWASIVDSVQFFINSCYHRSIDMSPYEAFFGEPARTPLFNALGPQAVTPRDELSRLSALYALHDHVIASSTKSTAASREAANKTRRPLRLAVGDVVSLWRPTAVGKLDTNNDKIAHVSEIVSDNVVYVKPVGDVTPVLAHVSALKRIDASRLIIKPHHTSAELPVRVLRHRRDDDGLYHFLIEWPAHANESPPEPSWSPGHTLSDSPVVRNYCLVNRITFKEAFKSSATAAAPAPRLTSASAKAPKPLVLKPRATSRDRAKSAVAVPARAPPPSPSSPAATAAARPSPPAPAQPLHAAVSDAIAAQLRAKARKGATSAKTSPPAAQTVSPAARTVSPAAPTARAPTAAIAAPAAPYRSAAPSSRPASANAPSRAKAVAAPPSTRAPVARATRRSPSTAASDAPPPAPRKASPSCARVVAPTRSTKQPAGAALKSALKTRSSARLAALERRPILPRLDTSRSIAPASNDGPRAPAPASRRSVRIAANAAPSSVALLYIRTPFPSAPNSVCGDDVE